MLLWVQSWLTLVGLKLVCSMLWSGEVCPILVTMLVLFPVTPVLTVVVKLCAGGRLV